MDSFESIFPIHRLFQVTCLTQLTGNKADKLHRSTFLTVYTIIILSLILVMFIYGLFDRDLYLNETHNDVGNTVDFIQLIGIRVAHIVAIIESLIRNEYQRIFYQKVQEVDEIFEKSLNENLEKKKFRAQVMLRYVAVCSIYVLSELFVLSTLLLSDYYEYLGYWFSYFIPLMITGLRYYQTIISIYLLKIRFDRTNLCLSKTKLIKKDENTKFKTKNCTNPIPTIAIYETGLRLHRINTAGTTNYPQLLILRDIYYRLWELSMLINKCYGISMLINIGNDFVSITANCYWMFLRFKESPATYVDLTKIFGSAIWSIPHFFNVIVIATICHITIQSASNTALIAHKIEINAKNANHNSFIEQFSLQLLHQKVTFTAFGFFNIDFTLLYTIAGATTTYLIILIQFHMSELKNALHPPTKQHSND